MEDSVLPNYVMIRSDGETIGGLRQVSADTPLTSSSSVPILYFTVSQLEIKIARAKELGAEIVGNSVELGKDRGRYQWIRDREKNLIGLWAAQ